jgi:hypothetical protein
MKLREVIFLRNEGVIAGDDCNKPQRLSPRAKQEIGSKSYLQTGSFTKNFFESTP